MLEIVSIKCSFAKRVKKEGDAKAKGILQNIDSVNGYSTSNSKWESEI